MNSPYPTPAIYYSPQSSHNMHSEVRKSMVYVCSIRTVKVVLPCVIATSSPVVLIQNAESIGNGRRPVKFDVET